MILRIYAQSSLLMKRKMKDFVCRLEDHSMPAECKRHSSRQLCNLIWNMITVEGTELCPTELAMGVGLF
jgi:hypothetical protein